MKSLLGLALAVVLARSTFGDGMATVEINGTQYTNITKAYLNPSGLVIILFPDGGTSASVDKVPTDFLESWKINQASQEAAKITQAKTKAEELERAIAAGYFREVDGIVYDIRKPQSGWSGYYNAKVLQVLSDGVILDLTPDQYQAFGVYVKNLPGPIADTDTINFIAKFTGSFSYINKLGDDRTIRKYDVGRVCSRDEIPDSVLTGKKAFDALALAGVPIGDAVASLPESDELRDTGSGFFITEDGYLITNFHVVRGAKEVNSLLKNSQRV
jgi:S1-C subfamily serine protease